MLLNPARDRPSVIPGTRILEDQLGLPGTYVHDHKEPWRHWHIQWLFAPLPRKYPGGIRAKLVDTKGFITFINQRDLEVILGHGKPGEYCHWTGKKYPNPEGEEWWGHCCDEEDLQDDLFERECSLRQGPYAQYPYLPQGLHLERRIHLDYGQDVEELHTLLWDMDPDTGQYPDPRLEMVTRRWARVERTQLSWERTL